MLHSYVSLLNLVFLDHNQCWFYDEGSFYDLMWSDPEDIETWLVFWLQGQVGVLSLVILKLWAYLMCIINWGRFLWIDKTTMTIVSAYSLFIRLVVLKMNFICFQVHIWSIRFVALVSSYKSCANGSAEVGTNHVWENQQTGTDFYFRLIFLPTVWHQPSCRVSCSQNRELEMVIFWQLRNYV